MTQSHGRDCLQILKLYVSEHSVFFTLTNLGLDSCTSDGGTSFSLRLVRGVKFVVLSREGCWR